MPELPEVETIKRDLESELVGLAFTKLKLLWPGSLKGVSEEDFSRLVLGKRIIAVERRAKNLAIRLANHQNLLLHMKMTGHLLVEPESKQIDDLGNWQEKQGTLKDPNNQYVRVIFWLNNGNIMAFSDLRKFGYIKLLNNLELNNFFNSYGPEPLSNKFNVNYLTELFQNKKQAIKKVLMDQKNIAGIGNIYADEILWFTKIHPETPANQLTKKQVDAILSATIKILKKAIALRGTSSSDYRDTKGKKGKYEQELKVYRKIGEECPRCKGSIKRITVGGRGTHFCPACQQREVK